MDKLILVPFIISSYFLYRGRKPAEVFILVFLPFLTLFPTYFDVKLIPGIPEFYFWSAALIPIFLVWIWREYQDFEFVTMDWMVLGYVVVIFLTQLSNSDYSVAQKILYNSFLTIFVPYIMIRSWANNRGAQINAIKTMLCLGAVIAVFNAYEARMFFNFFDQILRNLWPRDVVWDTGFVMQRAGMKRAMGPFGHPIIAGYFFALMVPLAVWCHFHRVFKNRMASLLIIALNFGGLLASLSRGPIAGVVLGLGIIYFGWSNNKRFLVTFASMIVAIGLLASISTFMTYVSVTRDSAVTEAQRNAAYRKIMLEEYSLIVLERPFSGWGRSTVPKIRGMESIDNEYLGIALSSGLITLSVYLTFIFGTLYGLWRFCLKRGAKDPQARLGWCIVAGWMAALFTQGTVYSGGQALHYFFMMGALAQNLRLGGELFATKTKRSHEPAKAEFGFARIL